MNNWIGESLPWWIIWNLYITYKRLRIDPRYLDGKFILHEKKTMGVVRITHSFYSYLLLLYSYFITFYHRYWNKTFYYNICCSSLFRRSSKLAFYLSNAISSASLVVVHPVTNVFGVTSTSNLFKFRMNSVLSQPYKFFPGD